MNGSPGQARLQVESFYDEPTSTFSHVVHAGPGTPCAVIDPVLGYQADTALLDSDPADALLRLVEAKDLRLQWIVETHVHADHLTAAAYLRERAGGRIVASTGVAEVRQAFRARLGLPPAYCQAQGQFDQLFADDDAFAIGALQARVLHVPGHTPADLALVVQEQAMFVGDTLFQPDLGTARCDFPGGSAARLYHSIQRLLQWPPATRLYLCHDYPRDRAPRALCTVAEQLVHNRRVPPNVDQAGFVAWREARDAGLDAPRLMLPALLWNLRAGVAPPGEVAGVRFRWSASG